MRTWKYQIALLGSRDDPRVHVAREAMRTQALHLGLNPNKQLTFFSPRRVDEIDPTGPVVGMFFGGDHWSAEAETAVGILQAMDAFILPIVPTTSGYIRLVPASLKEINGHAAKADAEVAAATLRLVEELGLVRRRRLAFLSYCRRDSKRAAEQIYHRLDAAGWQVFMDTHSVSTGVPFQDTLMDRLNDADMVLLLDSNGCKNSEWVGKEIARASNLGLGILQVVWPEHKREDGTEFADCRYLSASDFRGGKASSYGGNPLRADVVKAIALQVESIRARALAARRTRLVRELCSRARRASLPTHVHAERFVEVRKSGRSFLFVPCTGQPRSPDLHDADALRSRGEPHLLYDPTGMLDAHRTHVDWLNEHLPVEAIATTDLTTWIASP